MVAPSKISPMTHDLVILTGASRGLGLAMASQLLSQGCDLLCISRHENPALAVAARQHGQQLTQWTLDLAQASAAAQRLRTWLENLDSRPWQSVTLINNAGVIPPIAPLSALAPQDMAHALRVGLEAPLLLCAAFLGATEHWPVTRKVLNISSGLGRRPMASQAVYCAAKAGLDHASRCLALEEARKPRGARVCSLAPGVIDTDMQRQLRSADPADFPDQGRFAQLRADGLLSPAQEAARQVLDWLARPDFGSQPVADVRDSA